MMNISRSIKYKIIALIAFILLLSQFISFVTTFYNINKSNKRNVKDSFSRAEQVISTLVDKERERLGNQAKLVGIQPVLVAVADTQDEETIVDSVSEFQGSLGLEFFDVYDTDGDFMAGTDETSNHYREGLGKSLASLALGGEIISAFAKRDGKLVIIAAGPIGKPPATTGAMVIGVNISDLFATKVRDLTSAETSFILEDGIKASSLESGDRDKFFQEVVKMRTENKNSSIVNDYQLKKLALNDFKGEKLGDILIKVSLKESQEFFKNLVLLIFLAAILVFTFFLFIGAKFSKNITEPIVDLQNTASRIEESLDFSIRVKEQGRDEIFTLSHVFNKLLGEIEKNHQKLKEYSRTLEDKVEARTRELAKSNEAMTDLLNNLDEGFMVFDRAGIVQKGSSRAAHRFFSMDPTGKEFYKVLHLDEDESAKDMKEWHELMFDNETLDFDSLAAVGPKSFTKVDGRYVRLEYRAIYDKEHRLSKIICIAADKTQEMKLAREAEKEKATAKLVMSILEDKGAFIDFVIECRRIIVDLRAHLECAKEDLNLDYLFRYMHTIKGGSASYHFIEPAKKAHELENVLQELQMMDREALYAKLNYIKEGTEEVIKLFEKTLSDHANVIGEIDEGKSAKLIDHDVINNVYKDLSGELSEKSKALESYRNFFLLEDISHLFSRYEKIVHRVAEDQSKSVKFNLEGSGIFVDTSIYKSLVASCIHIFRNAVDHGIEDMMTREMFGKSPEARIDVKIQRSGDHFFVIVEDDGQGIDHKRIGKLAIEKGLLTQEELESLDEAQIIQLIFHAGFSTKEEVSETSGRGVGLDSVMFEAKKLGGMVVVKTVEGEGSQFIIKIPIINGMELAG